MGLVAMRLDSVTLLLRPLHYARLKPTLDTRTGIRYIDTMIRTVRHRGLKRAYDRGDFSKVRPDQAKRIAIALADLDAARKVSDLNLPGYRLHPLKGSFKRYWGISISGNWRIVFRFEDGDAYDVDLIDYH